MDRKLLSVFLLMAAAALVAACGATPPAGAEAPETPIVQPGGEATDYESLLFGLSGVAKTVDTGGEVEQPFFSVKGQLVWVDGYELQVFEYASVEEAVAQAALVSPDGGAVGTSLVSWIATPHFFQAGRLIVLYVGDDAQTLDTLAEVLGPQFAGGAPAGGLTPGGGMPLPAADAAVKDLAALRGIPADQITVLSAVPVMWPNSCLGVEGPERICALVVMPGYRIVLQVGAEQVAYHTDQTGASLILVP